MKITVFGSGYVGLVTGACLASAGNEVMCVDIDQDKIANLKKGILPIYENGLEELILSQLDSGRLNFTSHMEEGVQHGLFQFIAVGTAQYECGAADDSYVLSVAESIGNYMDDYKVIINKSTVPVGTADKVNQLVRDILSKRSLSIGFDVVSNPEFLREGTAIDDFIKPDRIIIGCDNKNVEDLVRSLYAPFSRDYDRIIAMDSRSAELTKYAANAMLATKITFMNELSNIAERTGADIENVRVGIGADSRIGHHFIYAGPGYGGSCFPKDLRALTQIAHQHNYDAELLKSVESVNLRQKHNLYNKIKYHFGASLKGKTIALWGLAFKPETDDMREAPSRALMELLWKEEVTIQAYDPRAMNETARIYGQRNDLLLCESAEDALAHADALVIMTEWNVFRSPDFVHIKEQLLTPVIFDGRNIYTQQIMDEHGFTYYAIGRGKQIHNQDSE